MLKNGSARKKEPVRKHYRKQNLQTKYKWFQPNQSSHTEKRSDYRSVPKRNGASDNPTNPRCSSRTSTPAPAISMRSSPRRCRMPTRWCCCRSTRPARSRFRALRRRSSPNGCRSPAGSWSAAGWPTRSPRWIRMWSSASGRAISTPAARRLQKNSG